MVARRAQPINDGTSRPPRGVLTWAALAGIIVFIVLLITMIARPAMDNRDGGETAAGRNTGAAPASQNPPPQ